MAELCSTCYCGSMICHGQIYSPKTARRLKNLYDLECTHTVLSETCFRKYHNNEPLIEGIRYRKCPTEKEESDDFIRDVMPKLAQAVEDAFPG
ncbi:MAG: hypothetical protein JW716_00800 [Candidatus Aenigmarchaeota archaeon]|nr:hypothetical protein [Candidatus Aenigmarchaeota archaeon]